jgi:hypothetical protein
MATAHQPEQSQIRFLDDDESHAFFDAQARRLMNMSGEEFLRRYDAGEFDEVLDDPRCRGMAVMISMIPFGR